MSVIIIAEAGVNHNGNIDLAKELIDIASDARADYIKFQTYKSDSLVHYSSLKANYQKNNKINDQETQLDMLKKLELSHYDHIELIEYCKLKEIKFLSSAFDLESLEYLNDLNLDMFKIPSGEITNYPYLKKIADFGKPVILSTGMSSIKDIRNALNLLVNGKLSIDDITVLHCNTDYPTSYSDVNIHAMNDIKNNFRTKIGYSDHTLGIEVSLAAVALGATIIEKHFTIDRNLNGPDHKASLNPKELKKLVSSIRNIELSISGTGNKEITNSERKNIKYVRKSLYYNKSLLSGYHISAKDIISLRPGDGISPMEWNKIIGKRLKINVKKLKKISFEDFE
mgnify:CR=1 FL=1